MIKKQLENPEHPINEILIHFNKTFFQTYSKDIEKVIRNIKEAKIDYMPKIISEV